MSLQHSRMQEPATPVSPVDVREPETTTYWEIGGHPNFLLSVDERVIQARERLTQVSDTSLTIVLAGERGVGKEIVARGIHNLSSRARLPYVSLNTYAVPRSSLGRELFNDGPGGKLQSVAGGTLHIHGIELIPDDMRLRLIEWRRDRVDKDQEPRFVFSCETPSLEEAELLAVEKAWSQAGGAVKIEIPPLRERPEDIALLANHILQKYGPFYGSRIRVLRSSFIKFLQGYRWPGNTRELERVVRRFLVIEDEEAIRQELGSKQGDPEIEGIPDLLLPPGAPLKDMVSHVTEKIETQAIERALEMAKWNKKRAAADLDISYKTLLNKVKLYKIEG